jgi:twitching motility protein PilT
MPSLPQSIFEKALAAKASDVHVVAGSPLMFRIDGQLVPQTEKDVSVSEITAFVKEILGDAGFKRFEEQREVDASFALPTGERLRVNCHFERGMPSLAARVIPADIPSLEELGLVEIAPLVTSQMEGLVLFTGPTGCGKSTSLASLIQSINQTRNASIITLEDPVEFMFPKGTCLIRQRQYGDDFLSFPEALKFILRQDPNIVMVGEMRDPETIAAALTLAETGHLILATLHTPNTAQSIDRMVDVFPPHQQLQVRLQLSLSLKAIVAQRLLPKTEGGRTALREVLVNTPAISNMIRDNRLQEVTSALQTGADVGMVSFEKDLKRIYKQGLISKETFEAVEPTL